MVQVYSIAYVSHVDPPRTPCLENGKIAVRMIKDSCEDKANAPQFDAVFLDKWATLFPPGNSVADRSSQMPLMSGVEVARKVRGMGCPVYIVGCMSDVLRADQVSGRASPGIGVPSQWHESGMKSC
jgi:hypothetical protein